AVHTDGVFDDDIALRSALRVFGKGRGILDLCAVEQTRALEPIEHLRFGTLRGGRWRSTQEGGGAEDKAGSGERGQPRERSSFGVGPHERRDYGTPTRPCHPTGEAFGSSSARASSARRSASWASFSTTWVWVSASCACWDRASAASSS